MNEYTQNNMLPPWFTGDVEKLRQSLKDDKIETTAMLSQSRKEFYDCLETFYSQTRYLISFYPAAFTVAFGMVGFFIRYQPDQTSFAKIFAGLLLFITGFICVFAYRIMSTQYSLYVAALIDATQLHMAVGLDTHRWFEWVQEYLETPQDKEKHIWSVRPSKKKKLLKQPDNKADLISRWMWSKDSTSFSYFLLVFLFAFISFASGVVLVLWAILV